MSDKKLFLLDAMALIYRAHFAFIKNPRITSTGQNTSAIFGFTNSLLEILNKENPSHIGVAFDTAAPTFRHEEFEEYKAGRDEVPEDIISAIPLVKKLLKMLNIPVLEKDGFEADDIIGTLAWKAASHGYKVYMVTPDKDFAQLVNENVFLYKPSRMGNGIEILDSKKVEEKFGIPPQNIVDFLGLKGDKVDNIPGVPKVGDKTAVELIKAYGSVENIIKQSDSITKNAIRLSIQENAEQGLLSKKLATIHTEVPVSWDEEHLKIGNPDKKGLLEFLKELEFRRMAERVLQTRIFTDGQPVQTDLFGNYVEPQGNGTPPEAPTPSAYETIETRDHEYVELTTIKEIESFCEEARKLGSVTFDTETTSLDPMSADLIAITFSLKPGTGTLLYFPENDKEREAKLAPVKRLLEDPKVLKTGQNLKYDMLILKNFGISPQAPLFDTMLADYVINPDRAHSMDKMAMDHLNYEPVSITSLIGKKGKGQLSMRSVPKDSLLEYACEDADITLALKENLESKLGDTEIKSVFEAIEMPLVPVLTEMEFTGVRVDVDALKKYSVTLAEELKSLEGQIYALAGMEFNINSPKQLGEIIFERLQLAKGKKTKTGQWSTKEEVLTKLADEHELPSKVLRFRQLAKLKSTYVDALPELINPKTNRIHTTYSQALTATGRLSSNHPNLQNIPIRTEDGREIRKAFIPAEGYILLAADYSQVELRLMADLSKDPGMMEAFIEKQDIHKATASKVFGVDIDEVTSDMRSKAKMVNFGIIYGISAFGLGQRLKISRGEAAEIIEAYFNKYPQVKEYMDASIQDARDTGYAKTIMGRRRYLPDINSQNATVRGFAERNAINTPVQGSAADLIKIAMINIQKSLVEGKFKSRMIMQVHDELVFEVVPDELEKISALIKDKMENAISFSVPMEVEIGTGENWLQAH